MREVNGGGLQNLYEESQRVGYWISAGMDVSVFRSVVIGLR